MARNKHIKQKPATIESVKADIEKVESGLPMAIENRDNYKVIIDAEIAFHELKLEGDGFMPINPVYKFETKPEYAEYKRILLGAELKKTKALLLGNLQGADYEVEVLEKSLVELKEQLTRLQEASGVKE